MERLESLVGQLLDARYQLHSVIGAGGSAVVFFAEDMLLHRPVAIKMLRSTAAPEEGDNHRTAREMAEHNALARRINRSAFRREALAAAALSHPNIVATYDVSPDTDNPYIVMEYVDGESLSTRIEKEGVLPVSETLRITRLILSALCQAHEAGIIHRDIKAQNILLTADGQVKITDFGIAQLPGVGRLQIGNRVLGTVDTISPEQAEGRAVDERSDLYSLGVMMYQMATGSLPFTGDPATVAFMQVNEKPKYPSTVNPDIPVGLEQIILTALEKSPDDRFATATAMLAAVRQLEKKPTRVFRRFQIRRLPPFSRFLLRHGTALFIGIGVALAAFCVYLFIMFSRVPTLPAVTVVELPSYEATVYTDAAALGLDPRITVAVTLVYRPDLPSGTVISQSPAAGTRWKLDGEEDKKTLVLTVSTQIKPEQEALWNSIRMEE